MNHEFALHLSDIRLLQTLRLLEHSMSDHPDRAVVHEVMSAIADCRKGITKLAGAPIEGKYCA
jgi:hypothetical protein